MGTETSPPVAVLMNSGYRLVKLNNPLMGTETIKHQDSYYRLAPLKLN